MPTAMKTSITKQAARDLMPVVDKAIMPALAATGFEAFRFGATLYPGGRRAEGEPGFMVLKIKIRPICRT